MVVMVMRMRMRMRMRMMVMMVILGAGLGSLVAALGVRGVAPFRVFYFVSRTPAVVTPTQPRSSFSAPLVWIDLDAPSEIASIKKAAGGAHSGGRTGSIGWVGGVRSASDTGSQSGKHATKFHLDARVVATWANVSGLCSLNSLREWGIAASAIQLRTDVQYGFVDGAVALFALLVSLQGFYSLMVLECHRSV